MTSADDRESLSAESPIETDARTAGARMVGQLAQLLGAVLLLLSYFALQQGFWTPKSVAYLVANASGSATLAVVALRERQWGVLLLEGVWSLVSMVDVAKPWFV